MVRAQSSNMLFLKGNFVLVRRGLGGGLNVYWCVED